MIYLVNDWVYNSPVFGPAVRAAGFYPVSAGIEEGVEHLRKKVEQGFSLVVFPEGTRPMSNHIHRFHKGAFFLAEQFQLDILPITIHGNSETLPKGDFIIYDGSITVDVLERIGIDDARFGGDYVERTKKINTFFRSEFKQIRRRIEGPDYFKKMLLYSFDYKEWPVVSAVKKDVKANLDSYFELNRWLGEKDKILHMADDFGQLDVYLTLQEPTRKVTSFIGDGEKRAVAKTNYIAGKRHLRYVDSLSETIGQTFDVLLISTPRDFDLVADLPNKVVVWQSPEIVSQLVIMGYESVYEHPSFTVLTRKS